MSLYNPKYHHRKSIRLKNYDYAKKGLYFITLCVKDRAHIFGEVLNGKMILNHFGKIVDTEWQNTPLVRNNIALHEHIIMPNHIHGIIEILFNKGENNKKRIGKFISPTESIGSIIRGYKIATIRKLKDYFKDNNLSFNSPGLRSGESRFAAKSTGELQFAPSDRTSESQFAPSDFLLRNSPIRGISLNRD